MFYVVVTVKNRRGNLRRWCESIKRQTLRPHPIIVDYNSTNPLDGSEDYLPEDAVIIRASGNSTYYPEATLKNIGIRYPKEQRFNHVIGVTNVDIVYQKDFWRQVFNEVDDSDALVQATRMDAPQGSTVTPDGQVINAQGISLICQPSAQGVALASGDCQAMWGHQWDEVRGYNELMTGWGVLDNDLTSRCLQHGLDVRVLGYKYNAQHIHGWHEESPFEYRNESNNRNMQIAVECYQDMKWYTAWDYGTGRTQSIEWEVIRG